MFEFVITIALAGATGFSMLINRLHGRVTVLDTRLDQFELRVASNYVSKSDLNEVMERFETHMTRIENKLDKIILK